MTDAPYPLAGLKVLDLSRVLAGPFAGRMLCDLGADVVKVEPPDGDVTRFWGKVVGGIPGYFHQRTPASGTSPSTCAIRAQRIWFSISCGERTS